MAFTIHKYSADRLDTTVSILANAFVSNPLHISVFGTERIDQNRLFFRIGLRHMFTGRAFVALEDGQVRGYIHFNPSPYCLPAPEEIPLAATTLLKPLGRAIPQLIKWFARWCHLDPEEPHVHLGPIGVATVAQKQGIGTALMNRYIEHLKQEQSAGYLETDKTENVKFYEKFGFAVRREEKLLGTTVWYMWRPPDSKSKFSPQVSARVKLLL